VYTRERGGWGQGGSGGGWGHIKCTIVNRSCRIHRVCNFCEDERGSEGRGSKKNDTDKYEYRCDERLKTKKEESTRLSTFFTV
jgi:hypothetical protein